MRSLDTVGIPAPVVGRPGAAQGRFIEASGSTSVTSGVSNTLGAWTELIASADGEAEWVVLGVSGTSVSAGAAPALLDLAIGAAAAEVPIVSSLACGQILALPNLTSSAFILPVHIPDGARVSCRITNANASVPAATVRCNLYASDGRYQSPPKLVAIGANVASSSGVDVTSSATWTEVTSATAQPYRALVLTYGGIDAVTGSAQAQTAQLGVGPSGAEVTIFHTAHSWLNIEAMCHLEPLAPVFGHVATGTRLAVKTSAGATESITAVVLGVPYS